DHTDVTRREADPIVGALEALFAGRIPDGQHVYEGMSLTTGPTIVRAKAVQLFNALRSVSKDKGIPFPFRDAAQFGLRLKAGMGVLSASGFEVGVEKDPRDGMNRYKIGRAHV